MKTNSFGRKIKDVFSLTFKNDEEILKLWLNEQVSPIGYLKQLVLDDMNKKKQSEISEPLKENNENYVNFNFDMEE